MRKDHFHKTADFFKEFGVDLTNAIKKAANQPVLKALISETENAASAIKSVLAKTADTPVFKALAAEATATAATIAAVFKVAEVQVQKVSHTLQKEMLAVVTDSHERVEARFLALKQDLHEDGPALNPASRNCFTPIPREIAEEPACCSLTGLHPNAEHDFSIQQ